jgi:hypothetical protein
MATLALLDAPALVPETTIGLAMSRGAVTWIAWSAMSRREGILPGMGPILTCW